MGVGVSGISSLTIGATNKSAKPLDLTVEDANDIVEKSFFAFSPNMSGYLAWEPGSWKETEYLEGFFEFFNQIGLQQNFH